MAINGMDAPITHPTVTIGAETLTVKYSLLAQFKMSQAGLDVREMLMALAPTSVDPRRHSFVYEMFAACVAENYVDRGEKPPTAEQWTLKISRMVPDDKLSETLRAIGGSVIEAILKLQPMSHKPVQETPAQIPDLDQKPS